MSRIKTVERDPQGGWIARNPFTGKEILEEGFRWNCRESARTAVWEARHLSPEAKAASGVVPVEAQSCPHGIRHPHPCDRCAAEPSDEEVQRFMQAEGLAPIDGVATSDSTPFRDQSPMAPSACTAPASPEPDESAAPQEQP